MSVLLLGNRGDLAVQSTLRLPLPLIEGNGACAERGCHLRRKDRLLLESGAEDSFIALWMYRVTEEER